MIAVLLFALVCGTLGSDPRPCCVSDQFSGIILQLDGSLPMGSMTPKINDDFIYINYDYDNKMIAIESHALNTTTSRRTKTNIYNFYTTRRQFIATEDGHCVMKPMDSTPMTRPCIPSSFTFAGNYEIGSGTNAISSNMFVGQVNGFNTAIHSTADDCTPVAQNAYGNTPTADRVITNWLYTDMMQNHITPGSFNMPRACYEVAGSNPAIGKRDIEDAYEALNLPYFF